MLPFDPLTTGSLLILAAAQNACQMTEPTRINVVPRTEKTALETHRSHAEIQHTDIGTINPYGYSTVTHTNGFMEGALGLRSEVQLDYKYVYRNQGVCLWYKTVDIQLHLAPKIVIAKEVADDRCMYRAVLEHEKKHVNMDRKVANKYAKTIGKKIYNGLKQRGFMAGPVPAAEAQATADRMKKTVMQLIELESKKMEIERMELQQSIDSLEEYERVSAQCPNYRPPVGASHSHSSKRR